MIIIIKATRIDMSFSNPILVGVFSWCNGEGAGL